MPTSDDLAQLLEELRGQAWTRRLRRSDPQYGDLVRRLSPTATSLATAVQELSQLPADGPERIHHAEALRMARELVIRFPTTTIEDDLTCLLERAGLNTLQQEIVARRLGWDGKGGTTLEDAADGKLTRERVRQLEGSVRKASDHYYLPTVEAALELLAERAPIRREEAAEFLVAEGLARRPFDPAGLLSVAKLTGVATTISLTGGCVYAGNQSEHAARVADAARKLVSHNGAANVSTILDSAAGSDLDLNTIRRILELDPDVRWLDSDRQWLYLPAPWNRAGNYLRKMLAVTPSLSVADIREGFRRYDGREVILPRQVVRELCKCFDSVRVDGDWVTAAMPLDYREVLGNTEQTLVDIFRKHGPVLDRPTAVDLGEEDGLDRTTAGLYLGWSPIIERVAPNRYALRGTDIPAGTLEAMRGPSVRPRVQRGYGWTSTGRLWIGYTLSQAVIDSYVVGVPSALKNELCGGDEVARYDLAAHKEDFGQLATDGNNIWGLSRFLKRYAAEAGDALILEFDLSARKVHPLVGGQELFDPENRPEQVAEKLPPAPESAAASETPPGEPAAGLEELRPMTPRLFDAQMDLAAEAIPRASRSADAFATHMLAQAAGDCEPDATASAPTTTLTEALAPNRGRTVVANELRLVTVLELDNGQDESGNKSATGGRPASSAEDLPDDSQAPDGRATDSDSSQRCIIPGCKSPGKHKLGVRCRVWYEPSPIVGKSKTSALWAPDADAFLCDQHALGGAHITLIYEPNSTGETAIKVIAAPEGDDRRTPIRHEPRKTSITNTSDPRPDSTDLSAD